MRLSLGSASAQTAAVSEFVVFFLFKQKSTSELRISDWSSDVCSSDLLASPTRKFAGSRDAVDDANSGAADRQLCPRRAGDLPIGPDNADLPVYLHCPLMGAGISDRKSVVSGKSVSVRVDLGGRRIIKKKNYKKLKFKQKLHVTKRK